jgi:hypothetical protein
VRFHSSWPGLSRPSTSLTSANPQVVDARDKRGHDEEAMRVVRYSRSSPRKRGPRFTYAGSRVRGDER